MATMPIPSPTDRPAGAASRRGQSRRALPLTVEAIDGAGTKIALLIRNMSGTGLLVETDAALDVGDRVEIDLPHAGRTVARAIWNSDNLFGCAFDEPVSPATLSAVQLRSSAGMPAGIQQREDRGSENFGARLHRMRIRKGLSQSDLAAAMNVSAPAISGWEKGRARPKQGRMQALAIILGVPLGELLGEAESGGIQTVINRSRDQIARAVGTSIDKVRIVVEL